jgi:hypothetical protein
VRRALLSAGLVLLPLLALELTARIYLFGWAGLSPARVDSVHRGTNARLMRPSSVPGLVFELRPNLDIWFKLVRLRTNAEGLRDRSYPLEKPAGTFRVAVMGSSFTFPSGVAIEQAFHSRLEEQLSRQRAPGQVEFINFAVGAYGARQILALLEHRALAYHPDLILFSVTDLSLPGMLRPRPARPPRGMPPNGIERITHPFFQSFLARLVESRLWPEPKPQPGVYRGQRVGWLEGLVLRGIDLFAGPEPAAAPPAPAGPSVFDPVKRLADLGRRADAPVLVIRLDYVASPPDARDRRLEQRVRAAGMLYLDTRPAFSGTRPADFHIYELDFHPNAAAHAVFARVIGDTLRREGLIAPGTRTAPAAESP